jgi:hypothetical protein
VCDHECADLFGLGFGGGCDGHWVTPLWLCSPSNAPTSPRHTFCSSILKKPIRTQSPGAEAQVDRRPLPIPSGPACPRPPRRRQ